MPLLEAVPIAIILPATVTSPKGLVGHNNGPFSQDNGLSLSRQATGRLCRD
ncbi:hypothetical protein J6590_067963 [Homalodisca vitripennis]|nr:hypothetical protein J6590_067963 [Homalodisca vitripennis]